MMGTPPLPNKYHSSFNVSKSVDISPSHRHEVPSCVWHRVATIQTTRQIYREAHEEGRSVEEHETNLQKNADGMPPADSVVVLLQILCKILG